MALLFMDSFDHYATANILGKWTGGSGNIVSPGRTGPNCLQVPVTLTKTLDSSYTTLIVGSAIKITTFSNGAEMFAFYENTIKHIYLATAADGRFYVTRGDGTNLGITASAPVALNTWNYVEFRATISDTVGSIEVRVNGVTVISASSIDTRFGGTGVVNILYLDADANYFYDDLYVCDTSGSINNTFRGDVKIEYLLPNANGFVNNWTSFPSGANYTVVDDATPDDDTTYIYASGVGTTDSFAFGNLVTLSGSVMGVQTLPYARKDDAGTKQFKNIIYLSGVLYSGTTVFSLANNYEYYKEIFELSPATSNPWTLSEVNNVEFGVTITT